jgi:DNA-binding CsgD family transcriptional regulator
VAGGDLVGGEVPALCAELTHGFGREGPILAAQHEPRRHSPAAPDPAASPFLTKREREVVDLIARGLTNAAIAGRLYLSDKTVRNHVSNISPSRTAPTEPQRWPGPRDAGYGLAAQP